jgi:putative membrane protein
MTDQEPNRIRRIVGWGIIALIAVIGISVILSLSIAPRQSGTFFHYPFFPLRFGWLGGILLIVVVLLIARWWLFWPRRGYYSDAQQQRVDATSIVKERYAKGEITKEQFEQMLRDLRQQS